MTLISPLNSSLHLFCKRLPQNMIRLAILNIMAYLPTVVLGVKSQFLELIFLFEWQNTLHRPQLPRPTSSKITYWRVGNEFKNFIQWEILWNVAPVMVQWYGINKIKKKKKVLKHFVCIPLLFQEPVCHLMTNAVYACDQWLQSRHSGSSRARYWVVFD